MNRFEYIRPATVADAIAALNHFRRSAAHRRSGYQYRSGVASRRSGKVAHTVKRHSCRRIPAIAKRSYSRGKPDAANPLLLFL
jgi:hypothetical protein